MSKQTPTGKRRPKGDFKNREDTEYECFRISNAETEIAGHKFKTARRGCSVSTPRGWRGKKKNTGEMRKPKFTGHKFKPPFDIPPLPPSPRGMRGAKKKKNTDEESGSVGEKVSVEGAGISRQSCVEGNDESINGNDNTLKSHTSSLLSYLIGKLE
ncbi:hypothetical protein CEXT_83571 [Caerostris extrusa]|uniref:Uncharacterized protein n=1 Tax=Caerostris extrusa TaxID=172846 RepID=A0AAV4PNL4_CAEEX|nr:hypothetical protein CEXT_83571 [Caerostris extrusa]